VGQSWQNEPNNRSTNQVNCQQVARFAPNTDRFGVPKPKLGEDCLNEVQFLSRGMPSVPFRYVLNSLLYLLITGCRWCDLPRGRIWASKSAVHRWLKRGNFDAFLSLATVHIWINKMLLVG
jgi:transposase